jgi:hypothetical protein
LIASGPARDPGDRARRIAGANRYPCSVQRPAA